MTESAQNEGEVIAMPAHPVFDIHTYLGESPYGDYFQSPETLIDWMDKNEIERTVVCPFMDTPGPDKNVHKRLHETCLRFPGRFIPFARIDPRYKQKALDELKTVEEKWGFKGLLFNTVSTNTLPYHPGVMPLMEYAADKNLPVLIPSGQSYVALPEQIALLAEKLPSLRVIIGHMGTAAHAIRAISLLSAIPNLYLETSVQQSPYRIPLLSKIILEGRVMFGSGAPYSNPEVELLKIRAAGLPASELEMVLSSNARKFFDVGYGVQG
jgi:uncharacterized protein